MTPPIGQRIRTIRTARGMTQRQLAASIGRDATAIGAIERRESWADAPRLEAICAALGVTVEDIQSGDWRTRCARGGVSLDQAL